jgi:uncharacterized protein
VTNKPTCPVMTTTAGPRNADIQNALTARLPGTGLRNAAWRVLGTVSVGIGVINAFLPLLPTTVFLLIGAWAYGKGAPEWRERLLAHPRFGPPLRHWENGRRMTRRAKRAALSGMAFSFAVTWAALGNVLPVAAIGTGLLLLAAYLAQRPEPAADS